jgi:hypothetical protein
MDSAHAGTEGEPMTASQRGATRLALALSLALAAGCGRGESAGSEPPQPAQVAAAPSADGHIDPAPYRTEIEATEAVLYSSDALGPEERKTLSRALLELHNAIVFRDTSAAAREASRRLFFFSAQVDAESPPKRDEDELTVVRGVWEKIRAEQFTAVDWFRTAAAR